MSMASAIDDRSVCVYFGLHKRREAYLILSMRSCSRIDRHEPSIAVNLSLTL
jgi:hypothetical protein